MINNIDNLNREELEALYRSLLSVVMLLARLLGYPCPVITREERRSVYMRLDK